MTEPEYEVLSTILQNEIEKGAKQLVIASRLQRDFSSALELLKYLQDSFSIPWVLRFLHRNANPLEEATVRDFFRKSEENILAETQFTLPILYIVLSESERKVIFESGWKGFYRKFPKASGLNSVSRVGFNREMTQALACVRKQSDWLRGYGSFYLLQKETESWRIEQSTPAWRS